MRHARLLLLAVLLIGTGCGEQKNTFATVGSKLMEGLDSSGSKADGEAAPADGRVLSRKPEANAPPADKALPRKIIYTAQVELTVEDYEHASDELIATIKGFTGYIAKSESTGSPGQPRWGRWTVRVPVDQFEGFLTALGQLGELRRASRDSDDVTDRFYDMQARMKTKKVEEEGLQKLLLERTSGGKLEELLAVRRELTNIRADIEQMEGQLKRWAKDTELSTVTVTLYDRNVYVPPTNPDFQTDVSRTFQASLDSLVAAGKGIVLFAVALVPWLPVILVILLLGWVGVRHGRRARDSAASRT